MEEAFKNLSKYRLLEKLGSGATAEVYRAFDPGLEREVALKILKPSLIGDTNAFKRFLQEARSAAKLFHPNIATVLEIGEAEGRYYIAMRYIPGNSLDKILQAQGRLSWEETLKMAEQIALALDYAHNQGFVHRDIKPSNIIRSDSGDYVLTDFGLVKAMMETGLTTHTGAILGTPFYIPPELWLEGEANSLSDLYSLACVVYEAITGNILFAGETPPAVMTRHVVNGPEMVKNWPEGIPEGVENVLSKALAKNPVERYQSGAELVHALRALSPKTSEEELQGLDEQAQRLFESGNFEEAIHIWESIKAIKPSYLGVEQKIHQAQNNLKADELYRELDTLMRRANEIANQIEHLVQLHPDPNNWLGKLGRKTDIVPSVPPDVDIQSTQSLSLQFWKSLFASKLKNRITAFSGLVSTWFLYTFVGYLLGLLICQIFGITHNTITEWVIHGVIQGMLFAVFQTPIIMLLDERAWLYPFFLPIGMGLGALIASITFFYIIVPFELKGLLPLAGIGLLEGIGLGLGMWFGLRKHFSSTKGFVFSGAVAASLSWITVPTHFIIADNLLNALFFSLSTLGALVWMIFRNYESRIS